MSSELEADWAELLRGPTTVGLTLLDDLYEDWDLVQGRSSWFVGLFDAAKQLIPGTVTRTLDLNNVYWSHLSVGGSNYWRLGAKPELVPFKRTWVEGNALHVRLGLTAPSASATQGRLPDLSGPIQSRTPEVA